MGLIIAIVIIVLCVGLIVWRIHHTKGTTASVPQVEMPRDTVAHTAFVHGNTCLVKGEYAEAIASFQQTLELNPNYPHAAIRLVQAVRRQAA